MRSKILSKTISLFMKGKKSYHNKGFTLIETIVATFIIVMLLSSFIGLVVLGMKSFNFSKQRYIAAKIAQEGMELIINKRDNNVFCVRNEDCTAISDWQEDLVGEWLVDATKPDELLPGNSFQPYEAGKYLCIMNDPNYKGMFGYCDNPSNYIQGNFTRKVEVVRIDRDKVIARSIVQWKTRLGSGTEQLILEEIIFGGS